MNIALYLKNNLPSFHPKIGIMVNRLPFTYRPILGEIYRKRKHEIAQFEKYSITEKEQLIFQRMKAILEFAYEQIEFYKIYYCSKNFHPNDFQEFSDIQKVPIISKSILREYSIEKRSFPKKGRYIVNTGGTTGTPFSFYIEPNSMGHEWAHMHKVWEELEYKPSDLKLSFGGRSNINNIVEYDILRNSFAIDVYANYRSISKKLKKLLQKYNVKYLHGYPSAIYDFALYCKEKDNELHKLLLKQLKGAFLGSEFPHPHYREVIEDVFKIKTISWYGHTERCMLAYEKNYKYIYEPLQTYGYTEVVSNNLIATSYYNRASPLIRYNTEDEVSEVVREGNLLKSFQMKGGRSGEFVFDKNGHRLSLTSLIFGRHHEIFNFAKFIQVKQLRNGFIEIHYVAEDLSPQKASSLFDSSNVNMEFSFIKEHKPIRTKSGKINLLINNNDSN